MSFNPKQPRVPLGQAGGGQWGAARNAQAARAQRNFKAQKTANHFRSLPAGQRTAYLKGLSDAELESLTEVVYSHATSDPAVVQMRIAVANEMTKRGLDVKKYGALGGGLPSKGRPVVKRPAGKPAVKVVVKSTPKPAVKPPTPHLSPPGRKAI